MKTNQEIIPFVKLTIFNPQQRVALAEKDLYNEAYKVWSDVWTNVLNQEMNLNTSLYSNDFTRQQHILSLFLGDKCIGSVFMREIDWTLTPTQDDSYFRFWPKEVVEELSRKYQRSVIVSNFTIAPEFRNSKMFEWKTLLMCLFVDYFKLLDIPIMISAARKLKSNEKLCYQLGAKYIQKDVMYKSEGSHSTNESTDIVYWTPQVDLSLSHYELQKTRERLLKPFRERNYVKKSA